MQFEVLKDARVKRTREHELMDIVVIGLCCVICGGESFYDMEQFGDSTGEQSITQAAPATVA